MRMSDWILKTSVAFDFVTASILKAKINAQTLANARQILIERSKLTFQTSALSATTTGRPT